MYRALGLDRDFHDVSIDIDAASVKDAVEAARTRLGDSFGSLWILGDRFERAWVNPDFWAIPEFVSYPVKELA